MLDLDYKTNEMIFDWVKMLGKMMSDFVMRPCEMISDWVNMPGEMMSDFVMRPFEMMTDRFKRIIEMTYFVKRRKFLKMV